MKQKIVKNTLLIEIDNIDDQIDLEWQFTLLIIFMKLLDPENWADTPSNWLQDVY